MTLPRRARILVVDDDEIDREIVRRSLNKSGMDVDVVEVPNGAAALDLWDPSAFDCVLLDYQMQRMDGIELFRHMSQMTPDSPVAAIFLTGHGSDTLALELIGCGACDYLAKNELTQAGLKRAIEFTLARKRYLEQLNRLATQDSLTALANRALFSTLLDHSIEHARRLGRQFAVLLIDLDDFKRVNDTLGHNSGDRLLIEAARRLRGVIRAEDTVARLGGDEFAILAELHDDDDRAGVLADRIIETLRQPYLVDSQQWFISATVGISVCLADGNTAVDLLKNADLALYKAKGEGRGTYRFYTEDLNTQTQRRRMIELGLRVARHNEELDLHYQPRIDPRSGRILGAEALMRWCHPQHGFVAPDEFIPLAETTRLILPLGKWALERACAECVAWNRETLLDLSVSVNLSAVQARSQLIADTVDEVLTTTGLDPRRLEIEVTEATAMDDQAALLQTLSRLAKLGVVLSIDNFGTGCSSLARLHDLPLSKLKIDRSFVAGPWRPEVASPVLDILVSLGKQLKLEIAAEGVEDHATVDRVAKLGCTEAQGFFFSRPVPAYRFREWCAGWDKGLVAGMAGPDPSADGPLQRRRQM